MTQIDRQSYDSLVRMRAHSGLRAPDPRDFHIVEPPPSALEASAGGAGASVEPQTASARASTEAPGMTPQPSSGWDPQQFAALPEETRRAVQAGVAGALAREALHTEATVQGYPPADAARWITNPERFVDADGQIDRAAIRAEVLELRGSQGHDTRRHAPQDAGPAPVSPGNAISDVERSRARMQNHADGRDWR